MTSTHEPRPDLIARHATLVLGGELACLANDIRELGQPVVAGFSTHPHWDHLLWDAGLGAAAAAREFEEQTGWWAGPWGW